MFEISRVYTRHLGETELMRRVMAIIEFRVKKLCYATWFNTVGVIPQLTFLFIVSFVGHIKL